TAIATDTHTYSYEWVLAAALTVAHELSGDPRFERGGRIVLLQQNSPEYVASFYGVLLAGGVAVPLPPDIDPERLKRILVETDATHVLSQPRVIFRRSDLRGMDAALRPIPSPVAWERPLAWNEGPPLSSMTNDPSQLAAIFFTSGSSGLPKGVM